MDFLQHVCVNSSICKYNNLLNLLSLLFVLKNPPQAIELFCKPEFAKETFFKHFMTFPTVILTLVGTKR